MMEALRLPLLIRLHAMWQEKRGDRELPARRDFDPVELKFILGSLLLLDVLPGPRFRFRLHGTAIVETAGYDMTGKYLEDLPDADHRAGILTRMQHLLATRRPLSVEIARGLDGRCRSYEALWLPLSDDGARIDMLLCGMIYLQTWSQAPPESPGDRFQPLAGLYPPRQVSQV